MNRPVPSIVANLFHCCYPLGAPLNSSRGTCHDTKRSLSFLAPLSRRVGSNIGCII